ncbi:MAG TPA: LysR family transcriptional regulator [Paracoccaceae bacterium]|nr:LysR family transcriptional regulator [Paracoccaceae bacterium]
MNIKLEMLRCFSTVAREGNIVVAAGKLGRTPSAVSMMLKQFEETLGGPLFLGGRKQSLSPLGQFVLKQAVDGLDHYDHTLRTIAEYAAHRTEVIRLAAVPSVAGTFLPVAIRRFMADFPNIRLEVRDADSATILRDLAQDRIDIGLASVHGNAAGFVRKTLLQDAFGIICPTNHPLTRIRRPLRWTDVQPHSFIANALSHSIADPVFQEILARAPVSMPNVTSLLAMVRAGVGVTTLPKTAISLNDDGGLVFLPLQDQAVMRQVDILRKSGVAVPEFSRALEAQILAAAP